MARVYIQKTQIHFGWEMEDLERDIRLFIREYVNTLERLVKDKYQRIRSIDIKPWFPTEFPVRAVVYLGKRGIIINFEKADHFDVLIRKNERPLVKTQWSEFILYRRFEKIKDKVSEKAQTDINQLLNMPKMIEEHEQEIQRHYEALERDYWIEEINYTTEHYVEFLSKAKEVVDKTIQAAMQETYDMVKVIQNHLSNYEYMLRVGCKALDRLYFMINSDLETSLFLALNGKYFAAIAILRKILEVNMRSIYLSSLFDRAEAERETDDWISGGRSPGTFDHIVNSLIDDQIDQSLTDLLKKHNTFENASFKQAILSLYSDLCVFVHLRPQTPWEEDLELSFSEFKIDKFLSYYALFMKVMKISEILLVLKFPEVISTPSLHETMETYIGLVLSKQELDAIARFSINCSVT